MAFDPDSYLASEPKAEFDPDAYLASGDVASSGREFGPLEVGQDVNPIETMKNAALEVMAGVNRGAISIADIPSDIINAATQVAGFDPKIPRLRDQPLVKEGTSGGFVVDPDARQALGMLGEFMVPGRKGQAPQMPELEGSGVFAGKSIAEIDQIQKAGERAGVDVLTSDINPPKSIFSRLSRQFSERIPILGTGSKRADQQQARINAVADIDEATPDIDSVAIFESLKNSASKAKQAAGSRINDVSQAMDSVGLPVPVGGAQAAFGKVIAELSAPGKIKDEKLISEIKRIADSLAEAPQTFSSLREFRSDLGRIIDKVDESGRSQLTSKDKTRMNRVYSAITSDLDSFVLGNSNQRNLERYKRADEVYSEEARKLTKSKIKNILDKGDLEPELVNNLLFNSSKSQVEMLYKNLTPEGRNAARSALYRRAIDKSKGSPERFVSEMNALEKNFDVFFKGEARLEAEGLRRLMEVTKRASESGVVGPTGQVMQFGAGVGSGAGLLTGNPVAVLATIFAAGTGLGHRVYESSGAKNMLIRLGRVKQKSQIASELKVAIPAVLAQAAQAAQQPPIEQEQPN